MKLYPYRCNENAWHCSITWSKPRQISNYLKKPYDKDASLYMIIDKTKKKMFYLGMTHKQYTINRIKNHGYKDCFVSIGIMKPENYEKITRQKVENAESLLIYFYRPKDNSTKNRWINLKEPTLIENKGFYKFFPRNLYYGMCRSKP